MKVSLTVLVAGPMQGKTIPITIPRFVIGRAPQCNLQPGNSTISPTHCALEVGEDKVLIRDLGSATGTFVNERQVEGAFQLQNGDRLKVGPLIFGLTIEAVKKPPPPEPEKKKIVPDTAEMPLDATAEMNLKTAETVHDATVKPPDSEAKKPPPKPETKSTSQAAKELLHRYLRRRRSDEPMS